MKEQTMRARNRFLVVGMIGLMLAGIDATNAQTIKWLRVGQLQAPISETGAEYESEFNVPNTSGNYLSWPVQYNIDQTVMRSNGMMIACKNFNDPVEHKPKGVKVVSTGFKAVLDAFQIFPQEIRLIGKRYHPKVFVDGARATVLDSYDILDEVDPNLPCDRMVVVRFNTSMGISVTKKVMAFASSNHSNYFIFDYAFVNTGIVDRAGTVQSQTLDSVWVYFMYRYAFGGISSAGSGSTWGAFESLWGQSSLYHAFGEDPTATAFNDASSPLYQLRGFYAYYGPWGASPRAAAGYDGDWGCPKLNSPGAGTLASAKYAGCVTLHADVTSQNRTDNTAQPRTTWFISPDINAMGTTSPSQYDETFMSDRWSIITEGHPLVQHDDLNVGRYPDLYRDPRRNIGGGPAQGQGFGPYNGFAPGDTIHIVFAEGADGLSWEKGREVGANWYQWYTQSPTAPVLNMPDGSQTTNYDQYKLKWCETGRDNILKTYRNAKENYDAGYSVPQAPPPPDEFTVASGGDKISLNWSNNAESAAHFGGYVIYRSIGNVLQWSTEYEKIFECNQSNAVNHFDDVTASRGFDYYYYIQSKDDGTQVPNEVLTSSLFWTVTSRQAHLQRPAEPPTPYPPDVLNTYWKLIASYKGAWVSNFSYSPTTHDVVTYNRLNYICRASISDTTTPNADTTHWRLVTSLGDSVAFDKGAWSSGSSYADSTHDIVSYSGSSYIYIDTAAASTNTPDVDYLHWKLLTPRGEWVSGSRYSAGDEVTYSGSNFVTLYAIASGKGLDLVRVVPNPYDIRGRLFQYGDLYQYDRITFFGLPGSCKLKIFTERGDLIWEMNHTNGTGDEIWNSKTSSGQIIASGIYILYVEAPGQGSVFRKFVVIR